MNKPKVYIDTSVIGGLFDIEFTYYTSILIDKFKNGLLIPVVSEIVDDEIKNAIPDIGKLYYEILNYNAIYLNTTDEVDNLVLEYINKKVVTLKYEKDAYHIAFATINKVDVLVSWNFKHIVNDRRIELFNSINKSLNYDEVTIKDPKNFLGFGKYK